MGRKVAQVVAYSFKKHFAEDILSGRKKQTIRAHRKRHARPGEHLQLFTGMRTKHCKKVLEPDPVCVAVTNIRIRVPSSFEPCAVTMSGNTFYVDDEFARLDGFASSEEFTRFWFENHGTGYFEGVLIAWEMESAA